MRAEFWKDIEAVYLWPRTILFIVQTRTFLRVKGDGHNGITSIMELSQANQTLYSYLNYQIEENIDFNPNIYSD